MNQKEQASLARLLSRRACWQCGLPIQRGHDYHQRRVDFIGRAVEHNDCLSPDRQLALAFERDAEKL